MVWNRDAEKPIYDAMQGGDHKRFVKLLRQHSDNLRHLDGTCNWLKIAARDGLIPFIELLVNEFGININEPLYPDWECDTAIDSAASSGHMEVVRWLLDHGARINFEDNDRCLCPSLVSATTSGHFEIVKLLIEHGANVNAPNSSGLNAVTFADIDAHFAIRDYLLSLGAKDVRETAPPDFPQAHKTIIDTMVGNRAPLAAWRVEVSGDPTVTVHLIPANDQCDHDTLFTVGLSDKNLPQGQHRFTHHELRIMLKSGWPLTDGALNDPRHNWPLEWL